MRPSTASMVLCAMLVAGCDGLASSGPGVTPSTPGSTSPASSEAVPDPGVTPVAPKPSLEPVPIDVVEVGFAPIPGDPSGTISYAAILRNPNGEWALEGADVMVEVLSENGVVIADSELTVTLLPGQTSAIAGRISGASAAWAVEVEPPDEAAAFVPSAATDERFDEREISTRPTGSGWLTTGTIVSHFERTQAAVRVIVVHRDAAGAIIGGASTTVEVIDPGASVLFDALDPVPHPSVAATEVWWQLAT